jgi:fructosamine-3-kinase
VDLAYLRAHPEHLPAFLTHQRIRETPVSGGSICTAARLTLDDGASVFTKTHSTPAPAGFFEAEAAGLAWLAAAPGGAPVPSLIAALSDRLVLDWIDEGPPAASAATAFGAALARTHRAGADHFGAAWPGYIGALPMDNTPHPGPWSRWFGQYRLAPYLRLARDRDALDDRDVRAIESLIATIADHAGGADAEPPARLHGDLWPGNLLWSAAGDVYLIDPAAHGGHRETDLANLALFGGAPHLTDVLAGYQAEYPLAPGWRTRVRLHQLFLLLAHAAMFGAGYRSMVMSAVRATVKA